MDNLKNDNASSNTASGTNASRTQNNNSQQSAFDSKSGGVYQSQNSGERYQPYLRYGAQNQAQTNGASLNAQNGAVTNGSPQGNKQTVNATPQNQSAYHNQARATAKFLPTNLPPESAYTSTGELSKEEMEYLGKISDQNYFIKKRSKKVKGLSFNEPRALSRVRRLYSLTFARKYYGFPPIQVKKLRDRSGEDKAKLFGAAARRTRNLIISIVLIIAILATLGTGAVVAILAVNSGLHNNINTDGLLIVNTDEIKSRAINNYSLGMWQDGKFYVKIRNTTNTDVNNITFQIQLSPLKKTITNEAGETESVVDENSAFYQAIKNKNIDPQQLIFSYEYDKNLWKLEEGQTVYVDDYVIYAPKLTYIGNGGVLASSNDTEKDVVVISDFAIDIQSSTESNKWANLSMTISFVVTADEVEKETNN